MNEWKNWTGQHIARRNGVFILMDISGIFPNIRFYPPSMGKLITRARVILATTCLVSQNDASPRIADHWNPLILVSWNHGKNVDQSAVPFGRARCLLERLVKKSEFQIKQLSAIYLPLLDILPFVCLWSPKIEWLLWLSRRFERIYGSKSLDTQDGSTNATRSLFYSHK